MAQDSVTLSAGDQRHAGAYRAPHGDLSPSALALAMVSGDSALVARHEAAHRAPLPPPPRRPSVRTENRRAAGGSRSPTRLFKGIEPQVRGRGRHARFSPYAPAGVKLDLLRSVLERRLAAIGGVLAARMAA